MPDYDWHPLTAERWADFERLFGRNGAYAGCWCSGSARPARNTKPTTASQPPGYVRPRRTRRSPRRDPLAPASRRVGPSSPARPSPGSNAACREAPDDAPVWSVVCSSSTATTGRGMMRRLLGAAIAHARSSGATVLEAYPKDLEELSPTPMPPTPGSSGLPRSRLRRGARYAKGRPIVRLTLS
ncbi:MAG: hypothetical protein M5U18_05485 [Dehalococcoidia bacterium]|nr:hypothetical protein [Dehalococcoidia bacterium]